MSVLSRFHELGPVARRRFLWGVLAAVLVSTSLLALGQAGRVRTALIADATTSAEALVDSALAPVLTPVDAATPAVGTRYALLASIVKEQVLADGTVLAVTIWAGDGTIVFADDVSLVGDEVRAMRTTLLSVIGGDARSDVFRGRVRSFVPVELATGVSVAIELDRSAEPVSSAADPWRLLALIAGAGALLSSLLLARTFTRRGRRAEGFDEEVLRAAVAGHQRAEGAREAAESQRDALAAELERTRKTLREVEQLARETARVADDVPRLRQHLILAAEEQASVEKERDALRELLAQTSDATQAEAARDRDLAAAREQLRALTARADASEEEAAKLRAELDRRQGASSVELEQAAVELEQATAALEGTRSELEGTRSELEGTRSELEGTRSELEGTGGQLRAVAVENEALRNELESLRNESDAAGQIIAAAKTELLQTTHHAKTLRDELASLGAERDSLCGELDALRSQAEARTEELEGARREADDLRTALETRQRELEAARAEAETGRKADAVRKELDADTVGALEARVAEAEARAKDAEERAEAAIARAERAEELYAEAETHWHRNRFVEAVGGQAPVTVSAGPDGPAVHVRPEPPPVSTGNGSKWADHVVARVEVDTVVRHRVQDTWCDRGRMVSVYAEPALAETTNRAIESIVDGLLERAFARTAEGNRIVLHVERADDGAMLSVEDGRPPDEDAMSPETRRLVAELGGWANVEEHLGGGAILRVFLPRSAPAAAGAPQA